MESFVLTYRGHLRSGETAAIRLYPNKRVVVVSEIPGRIGLSVTNGAECIATALVNQHDAGKDWEFIEHYPAQVFHDDEDTFDIVMFTWMTLPEDGASIAQIPRWRRINAQIVADLTGEDPSGWEVVHG
jgi:hypothetical protein